MACSSKKGDVAASPTEVPLQQRMQRWKWELEIAVLRENWDLVTATKMWWDDWSSDRWLSRQARKERRVGWPLCKQMG